MRPESGSITIPHKFLCRDYQIAAWEALRAGKKRLCCCWHRGAGKDLFALNYFITRMVQEPAVYLHCFPQYAQAKKAIWNSLHNTDDGEPMGYLDHFPKQLIKYKNSQEMRIELVNGSIYCVMGIDGKNAQLARGMNPTHVIVSEYAYMDEGSWDTIEPRVSQNKGTVLFLSTPNGKNHFYNLYNHASRADAKSDYFASKVTNDDTRIHSKEHIEQLIAQGKPEDFIRQEYFCDFDRGAQGSYYGKQIQEARNDDRITTCGANRDLPLYSAWDLGYGDSMAIWLFQRANNGQIRFLYYYENSSEALPHYLYHIDEWRKANKLTWAQHYAPHDIKQHELSTGLDRLTTVRNLGYDMVMVPKAGLEEGIEIVRSTLPNCIFDLKGCKRGIDCLDFYRKKWNESLKVYYDEPAHDQWSHGADAFRYACIGIKSFGQASKLSAEQIKEMRLKHLGY